MNKFYLHQIKQTGETIDKGIVVKDSYADAKQGYHSYLVAYAYNHDPATSYVQCMITDSTGKVLMSETWIDEDLA